MNSKLLFLFSICFYSILLTEVKARSLLAPLSEIYPIISQMNSCKIANGLLLTAPLSPVIEFVFQVLGKLLVALSIGNVPILVPLFYLLPTQALKNVYVVGTLGFFVAPKIQALLGLGLAFPLYPLVFLLSIVGSLIGGILGFVAGLVSDLLTLIDPSILVKCA